MALSPPGWLMSYWGNLLIVGGVPEVAHSAQYPEHPIIASLEDVSMHDTWFVIEAVLYGDRNTPCVVDVARYPYKSLPALKVNCFGDRCRFHSNKDPRAGEPWDETAIYEPVTVPNKEELDLVRQYPCILPFLVGLPWLCRRVFNAPHEPEGASRGGLLPSFISNRALSSVHSSLRQHGSQLIGTAGPEVEPKQPSNIEEIQPANTLILVHVFGEPIRMEHLKIFNLFVEIADLDNWWKPGELLLFINFAPFKTSMPYLEPAQQRLHGLQF